MLPCGSQGWFCGTCPSGTIPQPLGESHDDPCGSSFSHARNGSSSGKYPQCRWCNGRGERWVLCFGDCAAAPGQRMRAWDQRPPGPEQACLLIPAFEGAFASLALLLAATHERALDVVPVYVVLHDADELRAWR